MKARVAALAAGMILTLGTVSQAEQDGFCVVSVDRGAGTLAVVPANEMDRRARHMVTDHTESPATLTLVPRTNYIWARTFPNTDQNREWMLTQDEFLDNIMPGDVIGVDGPTSGPGIIWLSRWRY